MVAPEVERIDPDPLLGKRDMLPARLDRPIYSSTTDRGGDWDNLDSAATDMIEECARHNGHADLLRERVDGAVGESRP